MKEMEGSAEWMPFADFYREKRVLVTGHNGFVGSWLSHWLLRLGANVVGVSLPAMAGGLADVTNLEDLMSAHFIDVRDRRSLGEVIETLRPELVFHLAAQALVLPSYEDPLGTFETNIIGTANLLDSLRDQASVKACVVVTSDKCYAEGLGAHKEQDPLGGDDPYSASKGAAEIIAHSYRTSYLATQGTGIATARAGNIIGGGDWAAHRIVPDCMHAAAAGRALELRHSEAVRPWQHVLDAVAGYLRLGAALALDPSRFARAWNFGPAETATVGELVDALLSAWRTCDGHAVPSPIASDGTPPPERRHLILDSSRARRELNWNPVLQLDEAVVWTVEWYWHTLRADPSGARRATERQLDRYEALVEGNDALVGSGRSVPGAGYLAERSGGPA